MIGNLNEKESFTRDEVETALKVLRSVEFELNKEHFESFKRGDRDGMEESLRDYNVVCCADILLQQYVCYSD